MSELIVLKQAVFARQGTFGNDWTVVSAGRQTLVRAVRGEAWGAVKQPVMPKMTAHNKTHPNPKCQHWRREAWRQSVIPTPQYEDVTLEDTPI